jgi:hypothetical protein
VIKARKKGFAPLESKAVVVAGGVQDGVGVGAAHKVVALHAVFGLVVADHRLDGGPGFHRQAGGLGDSAQLPGNQTLKLFE